MNKKDVLKKISSLEEEIKDLKNTIQKCDEPMCITERVKTFDDACCVVGFWPEISEKDMPDEIAYKKLKVVIRALNEDWEPNWENENEYKWYPYFKASPFGFGATTYAIWSTLSFTGSRLCFKSKELAEYAGRQFTTLYKQYMEI